MVVEIWKKMNSFIYLENNILPTTTMSMTCSTESTCLAPSRATADSSATLKDFIFGTLMWGKEEFLSLVLLVLYCKIEKHYSVPRLERAPAICTNIDLWLILAAHCTPLFFVYPASYADNPGLILMGTATTNSKKQPKRPHDWP